MNGTLYIVATPLSNPQEITLEAIDILKKVDIIAAENLQSNQNRMVKIIGESQAQWIPYFDANETSQSLKIIAHLKGGKHVAIISSAGMPLICDPGYKLIQLAHKYQITIKPIGCACAVIGALVVSGLPCFPFTFWGFFHKKIKNSPLICRQTHIFFESSHRILSTVDFLYHQYPHSSLILVKDLGKVYFDRIVIDGNNWNNFNTIGEWVVLINIYQYEGESHN
jgi:16S rRNA (cytidine1402-2'-O)-methyltransferase